MKKEKTGVGWDKVLAYEAPTPKQVKCLLALGFPAKRAREMSKGEASRWILYLKENVVTGRGSDTAPAE